MSNICFLAEYGSHHDGDRLEVAECGTLHNRLEPVQTSAELEIVEVSPSNIHQRERSIVLQSYHSRQVIHPFAFWLQENMPLLS